jgi:ATP-binding cassette subfamily C (CFTR/MRP) protein 1
MLILQHLILPPLCVLQEPTLFRGSVRFNLDPFDQHTDAELWAALKSAHLAEHVRKMPCDPDPNSSSSYTGREAKRCAGDPKHHSSAKNGRARGADNLNGEAADQCNNGEAEWGSLSDKLVAEKGSNFSLGQRQLLCMARAILRQAISNFTVEAHSDGLVRCKLFCCVIYVHCEM